MTAQISKYITVDSEVCHGKPVFAGTRIMVYLVLEMLEAGESVEEILENYPALTRAHIQDVLHYAAARVGQERFMPFVQQPYAVSR